MASNDYHFITHWRVAGTLEDVSEIIGDAAGLTRWWPSVYLDVQVARRHAATPEEGALIPAPPQPTTTSLVPLLIGTITFVAAMGSLFYLVLRSLYRK